MRYEHAIVVLMFCNKVSFFKTFTYYILSNVLFLKLNEKLRSYCVYSMLPRVGGKLKLFGIQIFFFLFWLGEVRPCQPSWDTHIIHSKGQEGSI